MIDDLWALVQEQRAEIERLKGQVGDRRPRSAPRRLFAKTGLTALVSVTVALLMSGVTFASIPDANGFIHACFIPGTYETRIIDSSTQTCSANERALSWFSVVGVMPVANGGTGSSTKNFVDLSTNQTVGGSKTFTSALIASITGNAGSVTNGVYTTGNQTIGGTKTFTSSLHGSITGNAGTVTNGVYTTGNQTIGGSKTFTSPIAGSVTGNAGTVTNGVYTNGDQTIGGTKTFSNGVVANGTIDTTNGGFKFPDASLQTTAAARISTGIIDNDGKTILSGSGFTAKTVPKVGNSSVNLVEIDYPAGSWNPDSHNVPVVQATFYGSAPSTPIIVDSEEPFNSGALSIWINTGGGQLAYRFMFTVTQVVGTPPGSGSIAPALHPAR